MWWTAERSAEQKLYPEMNQWGFKFSLIILIAAYICNYTSLTLISCAHILSPPSFLCVLSETNRRWICLRRAATSKTVFSDDENILQAVMNEWDKPGRNIMNKSTLFDRKIKDKHEEGLVCSESTNKYYEHAPQNFRVQKHDIRITSSAFFSLVFWVFTVANDGSAHLFLSL